MASNSKRTNYRNECYLIAAKESNSHMAACGYVGTVTWLPVDMWVQSHDYACGYVGTVT